jgi:hypothetical protein
MDSTHWHAWGRYLAAGVGAAVISLFAFVLRSPVPIFDWVDLGVHELGHMIAMGSPRMLHFLAGSLLQVAFPAGLAIYFGWRQKDRSGAGFCMAWAGTSAWDVSVYVADAPIQALPLIGGGTHDWAYLLGPQGWSAMDRAGSIAGFVDFLGMTAAVVGISVAVWPAIRHAAQRVRSPEAAAIPCEVPIREPRAGTDADPLAVVPAGAFPSQPELVPDQDADPDPWLVASQLPFFHERSPNGSP